MKRSSLLLSACLVTVLTAGAYAQTSAPGSSGQGGATGGSMQPGAGGASDPSGNNAPTGRPSAIDNQGQSGAKENGSWNDRTRAGQNNNPANAGTSGTSGSTTGMGKGQGTQQNSQQNAQPPASTGQRNDTQRGDSQRGDNASSSNGSNSMSANVELSGEQRTRLRETVINARGAPRVEQSITVNVGSAVPSSVRVVEVPRTIVDIHPRWRGYRYFVMGEEIVIVEPRSLKVVAVLEI